MMKGPVALASLSRIFRQCNIQSFRRGKECRLVRLLGSNGSASEFRRGSREAMFALIR